MKLVVLCAVAACVAGLDLSCEEYCTCLSSGFRDVEYQPECECIFEDAEIDDSGIYYEPVKPRSLPAFAYNRPFYVINPFMELRRKHNTPQETIQFASKYPKQAHNTLGSEIEIDIENTHPSYRRKEKDIQNDYTSPTYLDIDVEDSERSASKNTFTAENLKLTQESLLECADLYTLLNFRKNNDINLFNSRELRQLHTYDNLSNEDLIKVINDKCLRISYILDKSLNEIKEKRPKKINNRFQHQKSKEIEGNEDILSGKKHNVNMLNATQSPTVDKSGPAEDYSENKAHNVVIYTDTASEENTINTHKKIATQDASSTLTSTSNLVMESSFVTSTQMDGERSTEKYPNYISNDRLHTGPLLDTTSIHYVEYSTTTTSGINEEQKISQDEEQKFSQDEEQKFSQDEEQKILQDQEQKMSQDNFNDKITTKSYTEEYNNREQYEEQEGDLTKIITREFRNNTVQSYINGTEDIPKDDFEDRGSARSNFNEQTVPKTKTADADRCNTPSKPDVHGNLYFLVNQQHVPAKFIQNPNGTLQIGIDAITICNKLKQDRKHMSKLLSTLCECYESDNCASPK